MTESEWLASDDVLALLRHVTPQASPRKCHLYLCGGCRHIWHLLYHRYSRVAVEVGERYADGVATADDIAEGRWVGDIGLFGYAFTPENRERFPPEEEEVDRLIEAGAFSASARSGGEWVVDKKLRHTFFDAAMLAFRCAGEDYTDLPSMIAEYISRVDWPDRRLVDCVFGNPFRPITLDPRWLTSTVVALAEAIYADRAFDRLPILADALQDAGCEDIDLLGHCRGPGPHVRGCWVVDLVLGKT